MYLIQYDSAAGTLTEVDTFFSTSTPSLLYNYYFSNVTPGSYLIKAALSANNPNFSGNMPTYFGQSLTWNSATNVVVGSGWPTNILNINLIAGNNTGGPGYVGGFVSQGANRTTGEALKDHSVIITTTQGQAVTNKLTDINGRFEWPSLAYGSYYVWVEVPGKPSVQALVTLSPNTPTVDSIQFEVGSNGITLFANQNNTIADLRLFPNPVQNQFYLSFDCTGMRSANYQIINNKGQVVANKSLDLINSCNTNFEVNIEQLTSGLYFLKLNADEKTGNIKFIKQ